MLKNKKILLFFIILFIGYSLLTAIIFYSRIETIFTHYAMPDIDTDGGMWYQWYQIYTQQTNSLFYITNLIAYPFGFDLTFLPFSNLTYSIQIFILQHILGFSWSNLVFITNLSSLITYPLSALGGTLLAYYLTKNKWASILAGLIFSFSYYHVFMARGEESVNHIELMPFYFLSLFYYLNKKNLFSLILSLLAISLLFNADAYYAFFSGIASVVILLFYKEESIQKKIKTFFIYYISLFIVLILTNLTFFYSNLYLFNHTKAVATGRNSIPKNELLDILFYFAPTSTNLIGKSLSLIGNIIFISIPIVAFSGLLFIKRNRLYITSLIVLLVCIVLSSYIPTLYWINILYFQYFGIFRGVSRMVMLGDLFMGLMVAIVISESTQLKRFRALHNSLKLGLFFLFIVIIITSSLSVDETWYRKTDFSKIASLYQPIKENNNIKVIANYPMSGCPQTYIELAQIIHNKAYACGASPFYPAAKEYYKKISQITNNKTISYLTQYGVDTILIDNKLQKNAKQINAKLLKDSRLTFVGHFSAPSDKGYVSREDLSRDFNLYQIKKVVENNKQPQPLFSAPGHTVSYQKISPEKYVVTVNNTDSPINLIFNSPYSIKWSLYDGDLSSVNNLGFLTKNPSKAVHTTYNQYANQWSITPNNNNSNNISVTIYFKPYALIYLFGLIQYITFAILLLYLLYYLLYGRVAK